MTADTDSPNIEGLPIGDPLPLRRRRGGSLGWLLVVTLIIAAAIAAQQGVFRRLALPVAAADTARAIPISPGCKPHTLWLIWRVEADADAHGPAPLYADIGRLERALVGDPHRHRFVAVIRGIESNQVGGSYVSFPRDFAAIVQSEPRC